MEKTAPKIAEVLVLPRRIDLLDLVAERAQQRGGLARRRGRTRGRRPPRGPGTGGRGDPHFTAGGGRSAANGSLGVGAQLASPGSYPASTSRIAAVSATLRVSMPSPECRIAELGGQRDPPAARLQPDEPAAGRGDPDRAAAVVAVRDRHHPGRDRRRGPAGGAAGGAFGVPRVARRAEDTRLAEGRSRTRSGGRADDHEPRALQAPGHVVVVATQCSAISSQP